MEGKITNESIYIEKYIIQFTCFMHRKLLRNKRFTDTHLKYVGTSVESNCGQIVCHRSKENVKKI